MQLCQCRDRIRRVLLLSRRCPLRSPEIRSPGTVHRVRLGARGLMFAIPLAMHCSWLLKRTKLVVADNPLKVHLSMSRPYFSKIVMAPGGRRSSLGWEGRVLTGTLGGEKPTGSALEAVHLLRDRPAAADILDPVSSRCVSCSHVCAYTSTFHVWNRWIACINTSEYVCACVYSIHLTYIRQLGHKFDFSLDFEETYN